MNHSKISLQEQNGYYRLRGHKKIDGYNIRSQKELYVMPEACRREKFRAVERTELSLWVVPNSLSKGNLPYEMPSATA